MNQSHNHFLFKFVIPIDLLYVAVALSSENSIDVGFKQALMLLERDWTGGTWRKEKANVAMSLKSPGAWLDL